MAIEMNKNSIFVISLIVAILIVIFIYSVKKNYRSNQMTDERFKQLIDKDP